MRPTVLIVDDHAGFRRMARRMLENGGFDVVAEAVDAAGALAAVHEHRPQLVLLDVQLPDLDGFAVAEALAVGAGPPVVVLTSSRSASDYGSRIGRSPAQGFVPKAELSGSVLADLFQAAG
jgi:CheY-like chemotaxis protein